MNQLQKNKEFLVRFCFFILVSCISCWSIILLDGWPHNHEYLSFFERVEVFKIALTSGDFFPLITPFAANGYGSMFPFFYHRLYNTLVSWGALALGSTYLAVKISIPLLLTLGAMGMYETAKELQLQKRYCFAASLLLIFANYTLTDWLIRGAMAEFTASMLVPWLFLYCLKIIQGKKASLQLGIVLSLMFFAHSVIFYYSIFVYLLAFILAFLFKIKTGKRKQQIVFNTVLLQLFISGIVVTLLVGFYAIGIIILSPETSLDTMNDVYNPIEQFQPFLRYLIDNDFHWRNTWEGFSVEIGRAIFIPLIAIILFLMIAVSTSLIKKEIFLAWLSQNTLFLIIGLFFVFLQLPIASWFYESIPGADYIQFPWRLLVFLTPIFIFLLCSILDLSDRNNVYVLQSQISLFLLLAILSHQVFFTVTAQNIRYERFNQDVISKQLTKESLANSLIFGGEYLPQGIKANAIPPKRPFIEASNCTIEAITPSIVLQERIHFNQISLTINASPSCKLYFNQFANSFIGVDPGKDGHVLTSKNKTIIIEPAIGVNKIQFTRRGLLQGMLAKLNSRSNNI